MGRNILLLFMLFSFFISNAERKRALLIGLSEYPKSEVSSNSWDNIHGVNDVELIGKTLKQKGFIITTLINDNATAKNIRKTFDTFLKESKRGDILYLHFSGHGQPVEDQDGDEEDGWDESIVPYDARKSYTNSYHGENHILDDELNVFFKSLRKKIGPTGYIGVAIDACHAGSAYRGEEVEDSVFIRGTNSGFSPNNKPYVPKIDKRSKIKLDTSSAMAPICLVEACRSYQTNCEIKENGQYYGPLSYYLNGIFQDKGLEINSSWAQGVSDMMSKDKRLLKQNIVIELSE